MALEGSSLESRIEQFKESWEEIRRKAREVPVALSLDDLPTFDYDSFLGELRNLIDSMPFKDGLQGGYVELWRHNGEKYLRRIKGIMDGLRVLASSNSLVVNSKTIEMCFTGIEGLEDFIKRVKAYDPEAKTTRLETISQFLSGEFKDKGEEGKSFLVKYQDITTVNQITPLVLNITEVDLLEVLKEIVTNGFKYGGMSVSCVIEIEAGLLKFTITDDGLGMTPERRLDIMFGVANPEAVLEKDSRVEDSTATGMRTGLRRFSKYEIESIQGEGTRVIGYIPFSVETES